MAEQRAIELGDNMAAELTGKTFEGYTLDGDSTPTPRAYVLRDIAETGSESRPVLVSIVARGKERARADRTNFGELLTAAVVVQQKLDPATDQFGQVRNLARLVEAIDDHLGEKAPNLGDAVFMRSDTNPAWNTDDLLQRNQFTGLCECEYDQAAVAASTPPIIANLANNLIAAPTWLRDTAGGAIPGDEARAGEWIDRISDERWTNSGDNRPTFELSAINGRGALRFDGDQWLELADRLFTAGSGSLYLVARVDNLSGTGAIISQGNLAGGTEYNALRSPDGGDAEFDHFGVNPAQEIDADTAPTLSAWHLIEAHSSGADLELVLDGETVAKTPGANWFDHWGEAADGRARLGALVWTGAVTWHWTGRLAELAHYDSDHSLASDRETTRAYFDTKYNLGL